MRCQVRNHSLLWRSAILVMMSDLPTLTWLPSTTLDMKLSISCRVAWDGYVGEGYRSVHILILILGVQPNLRKSSVNANHSRNGTSTLEAPSLETSTILARKHWKLSWVATNWHLRMLKQLFKRWNLRTRACKLLLICLLFFCCVFSPTYGLTMTDLSYSGVLAAVNSNKSICCIRTMPMNLQNWMELRLSNWSAVWQAWVVFGSKQTVELPFRWQGQVHVLCMDSSFGADCKDKNCYGFAELSLSSFVLFGMRNLLRFDLADIFTLLQCRSRRLDIRRLRQQLAGYVACSAQEVRTRFWSGNSALRDFGVDTLS